ncbi:hypothetical protein FTN73_01005 [Chlamydia trachomatis]|uniref:Uncharacterized protein n=3 Tax=Chlamydia trachomatis TaxID=813 RepID=O84798_CHLTR|nr:hypothetical protein [Chlamydia trachomatis]NP_220312.1 hypothetical protein CT_793 [Chlamydia trachomatis D/UW-3/CX]AAC68388.1 hypothetical protein CT_793 [Chlamydia trachomatis D/UW-3/CX]AAX51073.1 hypothetical protein CTA_0863 [Chlamydia trachomatis A/HAR-13]ADH19443.1 hypothetical protein G11222_04225 [Chlamydia trachomatis G/11222]AEP35685.1 hypothetical protein CTO_0863 [Chlamydia trachomatis A2497]AGS00774.1 hypothetical protein CTRC122_04340 [Chlamydia trachomatis RC-J(s)/122]
MYQKTFETRVYNGVEFLGNTRLWEAKFLREKGIHQGERSTHSQENYSALPWRILYRRRAGIACKKNIVRCLYSRIVDHKRRATRGLELG